MFILKKILKHYKKKKLLPLIIKKLSPYFDGFLLYFLPRNNEEIINLNSLKNPECLEEYKTIAKRLNFK